MIYEKDLICVSDYINHFADIRGQSSRNLSKKKLSKKNLFEQSNFKNKLQTAMGASVIDAHMF